ncbi:MAG: glycosyltransferase [Saccharofermentans sp.]|nr:glycosyltransferase [Saccharofermentans sp.]
MNKVELSIILPTYNAEKYVARSIDSVINQTFSSWELIIIDDGSHDNTLEILNRYSSIDSRIMAIHVQEHSGVSAARNIGLAKAQGQYVAFIDSDDWCEKEMFYELISSAKENNADIAQCSFVIDYENNTHKNYVNKSDLVFNSRDTILEAFMLDRITTSVWNKVFRKETIENIHFNESIKLYEDELFVNAVSSISNKVICINKIMYHYVQRADSAMNSLYNRNHLVIFDVLHEEMLACGNNEYLKELVCIKKARLGLFHFRKAIHFKLSNDDINIIKNNILEVRHIVLKSKNTSMYLKIKVLAISCFPGLYEKLCA